MKVRDISIDCCGNVGFSCFFNFSVRRDAARTKEK